jgi:hypothetical protein
MVFAEYPFLDVFWTDDVHLLRLGGLVPAAVQAYR